MSKTPRSKHRKYKSGIPLDEVPLIEGWLARESTVVERLLNKRYGALYPNVFATYRKDTDESPSKVWAISKEVTLTSVQEHKYHIRHAKTSTLWAVAAGAYDTKHMWGFTITWTVLVGGVDKLALAFDTKEMADEWHLAFTNAIEHAAANVPRSISLSGTSEEGSTTTIEGDGPVVAPQQATIAPGGVPSPISTSAGTSRPPHRAWASVLHINGISLYVEEVDEEGQGGAVMVSAVVRAPPADVFKSLVRFRKTEGLAVFADARTIEVIDKSTQVVGQTWRANGLMGRICAPREMVLLRTWRRDEDGTYIVLFQSTNNPSFRGTRSWKWQSPIRVEVQAAGFTIAPLLPRYTFAGQSQEALVTLVLKADLGGLLSGSTLPGRLFSPLSGPAVRSILEPVVSSIVVLRDRVEQNRFVVRPLSMTADDEATVSPEEEAFPPTPIGPGGLMRTSTMLVYRGRLPLAEAQQRVAERRPAAAALVLEATPPLTKLQKGAVPPVTETSLPPAVPVEEEDAWAVAGTCRRGFWSSPGSCGFKVRGATYLTDKKKIPAALPMFELVAVDLLELEEPMLHICRHLPAVRHSPAPFLFCVQLMVPSSPPVSLICTWAAPTTFFGANPNALIGEFEREQGPCPDHVAAFFRSFTEFVNGDGPEADRLRNARFKLIPNISKGSWLIRQSVGTTPVLLGQKLTTKYFKGPRYFEVDVDIGASSVAASITNLVCGATKSLALDMAVLVEGQSADHLPEQLAGTIRLDRLDLKTAAYFDEPTGKVVRPETLQNLS